jgi:isopropylmalate/homocitrate/citramalate synthase
MNIGHEELIVDWNNLGLNSAPPENIYLHDETLRDGLQSPSITQPPLGDKLALLHLMDRLGIDSVDIGMPVSGPVAQAHAVRLASEVAASGLSLSVSCAARTATADIAAVCDIAQRSGLPMWAMTFVGTSPIRMYAEEWTTGSILARVAQATAFARREGLRVCLVTEDTTRSRLDLTLDVYTAGIDAGAERICVCDTVGYATPWGTARLVTAIRRGLADRGFPGVGIDWHGHNDRGLALGNSLAAVLAGADRVHGTALGMGERAGNAAMEQLLANFCDVGWRHGDLSSLSTYCDLAGQACGRPIPGSHPLVGADVYRTAAGVHAAAIRKAAQRGGQWLAEHMYAGIPASAIGRDQVIEIGPGSGRSNILLWLEGHGIASSPALVRELRQAAASATRIMADAELLAIVADCQRRSQPAAMAAAQGLVV